MVVALLSPGRSIVSRGAVDIATLILIYVMLGLGLNIVVGSRGPAGAGLCRLLRRRCLHLRAAVALFWLQLLGVPATGRPGLAATFGFLLGFPVLAVAG
jgi:branched-chain amino acid transport system permease protein